MPRCNTLCVSNFPAKLNDRDREDLLKHFGARSVRCMPAGCRYQGLVFATFADAEDAEAAMRRLHQIDVLGSLLRAEYAKKCHAAYAPASLPEQPELRRRTAATGSSRSRREPDDDDDDDSEPDGGGLEDLSHISEAWGISYPANPSLFYRYPAPTVTILANMAHALATVPRFYVQTLHLMNKMNLPPPFGTLSPAPRLIDDRSLYTDEVIEKAMDISESSSESELEDEDAEAVTSTRAAGEGRAQHPRRPLWATANRRSGASSGGISRRSSVRAQRGAAAIARSLHASGPLRSIDLASVFDSAVSSEQQQQRKIAIKVSGQWTASDSSKPSEPDVDNADAPSAAETAAAVAAEAVDQPGLVSIADVERQPAVCATVATSFDVSRGFFSSSAPLALCASTVVTQASATPLAPVEPQPPTDLLSLLESGILQLQQRPPTEPTTTSEISSAPAVAAASDGQTGGLAERQRSAIGPHKRLTPVEISELPVFKNYARGDPCTRIYIKNLSKHVTEAELRSLFATVLSAEASSGTPGAVVDVRVMTEGRMKGQGFVTFDGPAAAEWALECTNGLVLHDKPMVVMFAKSAKSQAK